MSRLDESLRTARLILEELAEAPSHWTPLVTAAHQESTPWRVHTMIYWLLGLGYVDRPTRGVYAITVKGRQLLGALDEPRFEPRRVRRMRMLRIKSIK